MVGSLTGDAMIMLDSDANFTLKNYYFTLTPYYYSRCLDYLTLTITLTPGIESKE